MYKRLIVCGQPHLFFVDFSAHLARTSELRCHLMQTTTACWRQHCVTQRVLRLHLTVTVHQGRHRCMRVAVQLRTSLQVKVTVTSAMHQTVIASHVVHRVLLVVAASQRTVTRLDVVRHLRRQQLLKQVLLDWTFFWGALIFWCQLFQYSSRAADTLLLQISFSVLFFSVPL